MHRIGVFATRPADLHPLREHISALFGSLPDDAVWDFHYFSSWNRFRQALTRRELQLGLLVNLRPGEQFPELAHLCREHAIAVLGDQPLPADVTPVATLAPTGLDPAALQAMLRNALRRAELDDELRYLAEHDACTGLLRDEAFAKQLNQSLTDVLQRTQRTPASPALGRNALLCLRLDGYDELEATLGTASAERVLRMAAERLRGVLQRGELLARGNGPEFLAWLRAGQRIEAAAARLQQAFEAPFHLNESSAFVRASAGMARADGCEHAGLEEGPGDALIRQARAAADVVLQRTGVRSLLYDPGIEKASRRQQVRAALATAIERDEFDVFYQPIVNLAHGNVAGAEALLRWHDPELGDVSPSEFIPLAETSGLILEVGRAVREMLITQLSAWIVLGLAPPPVAMNMSPRCVRELDCSQRLLEQLAIHQVPAEMLVIEITEGALLENNEGVKQSLAELHAAGLHISIDDFGTGYSSLCYLKRLPLNELKIDKSFVDGLGQDKEDEAIARAVLALAQALELNTVAEGVETDLQLAWLTEHGCNAAQGFLLSRPLEAIAFEDLIARGASHG